MSVSGATLTVNTDCGNRCTASYEVHVAKGVRVTGNNDSGNVTLSGVSDVDIRVDSGDLEVDGATGDGHGRGRLGQHRAERHRRHGQGERSTSGNIDRPRPARRHSLSLETDSGNIDVADARQPAT